MANANGSSVGTAMIKQSRNVRGVQSIAYMITCHLFIAASSKGKQMRTPRGSADEDARPRGCRFGAPCLEPSHHLAYPAGCDVQARIAGSGAGGYAQRGGARLSLAKCALRGNSSVAYC